MQDGFNNLCTILVTTCGLLVTTQVHYIYCALNFHYYYISSTSDHQALDPGGWGPLL